jgi:predicted molibdopterin-dependent oxidoreductase YjgC
VVLAAAFAAVILEEKLHNLEFINKRTEAFAAYSSSLRPEVVNRALELTGISEDQLRSLLPALLPRRKMQLSFQQPEAASSNQ